MVVAVMAAGMVEVTPRDPEAILADAPSISVTVATGGFPAVQHSSGAATEVPLVTDTEEDRIVDEDVVDKVEEEDEFELRIKDLS